MTKDKYTRSWIIENGIRMVERYRELDITLTLRGLHYKLVGIGMTNTDLHYKRVIGAMTKARWDGLLSFNSFVDEERSVTGETLAKETDIDDEIGWGKEQIERWMRNYHKNRWENQPSYPEVFIEKKALLGVFRKPCEDFDVALCACKGYPSLTYLDLAYQRFVDAIDRGQEPVILYFGDYDPSGEDIPRSMGDVLSRMGERVEIKRIALLEHQVVKWNLPPAPTKAGDSRSATWDGLGQVELDAIDPIVLRELVTDAIENELDDDLNEELMVQEIAEVVKYRKELGDFVKELGKK